MFDRFRRARVPFVVVVAIGFGSPAAAALIGWLLGPDRRAQHPLPAILLGIAVPGLTFTILEGLRRLRSRRSAS